MSAAMTTSADLCAMLGNALGLPRRLAEETAGHLRAANMLPDGEDEAHIEHAVTLLLGLMAAPTPADAPDSARLYQQLPLDRVLRGELTPEGRTEMIDIADPEPLMGTIRELGETFGAFLASLVKFAEPGSSVEPGEVVVGGGQVRHGALSGSCFMISSSRLLASWLSASSLESAV